MEEPICRELTREECRERFLAHLAGLVNYWHRESQVSGCLGKMEGLVHSLLATIDGCSGDMPSFLFAPLPHRDDKQYHIDNGDSEHWPENHEANVKADLGGGLHEFWGRYCKYKYTDQDKRALGI